MQELVKLESIGSEGVTSLKIAEVFGKLHKNVIRDIENLIKTGKFSELSFCALNLSRREKEREDVRSRSRLCRLHT